MAGGARRLTGLIRGRAAGKAAKPDAHPRDTEDEARFLRPLQEGRRFALVTSASHMPRARWLFTGLGLEPVPPTEFLGKRPPDFDWRSLIPQTGALEKSERAFHEYWGGWWAQFRLTTAK